MEHKTAIVTGAIIAWAAMTFFIIRIAIPALINIQNDGALLLAIVVGIGWPCISYFAYHFVKEAFE